MMILCTRNVRGLNSPAKVREVKKFLGLNKISCDAFLETRVGS